MSGTLSITVEIDDDYLGSRKYKSNERYTIDVIEFLTRPDNVVADIILDRTELAVDYLKTNFQALKNGNNIS